MVSVFRIVIFLLVLVGRAFARDNSTAEVSWYRITPAHNRFQDSQPPCILRSESATRRDDYTYTPGIGGYKVHNRAATWHEARRICVEEGGHLAIINSNAESIVVTDLWNKADDIVGATGPYPEFAFIGFHDLFQEGEFLTIHGQSLGRAGFSRWSQPFQPDNSDENDKPENCGSMHKNGGLNDIGCDKKYGFICEVP